MLLCVSSFFFKIILFSFLLHPPKMTPFNKPIPVICRGPFQSLRPAGSRPGLRCAAAGAGRALCAADTVGRTAVL